MERGGAAPESASYPYKKTSKPFQILAAYDTLQLRSDRTPGCEAMMNRRRFAAAAASALSAVQLPAQGSASKLGVAVGCISANKWTPYQFLDYLAKIGVGAGQFPIGTLRVDPKDPDEAELRKIRGYADRLRITMSLSGGSICPTASGFNAKVGTPEEQIARGLKISRVFGAPAMRAVVGGAKERPEIEKHMASTARLLKGMRSQIRDSGVKVAIENHGGDFQARELKTLVEDVGSDILGVCIDSGNPLWMMEDPHLTLELVGPYAIDSHVRDTAVWRVPEGVAVRWVNMGDGNVDIDGWIRKLLRMRPGLQVMIENIVSAEPRIFRLFDPATFRDFPKMQASELAGFMALAERGKPTPAVPPPAGKSRGEQQCADLEVCVRYCQKLLGSI
jgi:3-oxoisoapionate decarboxylase